MKNDPFEKNVLFGRLAMIRHRRVKFFELYFCILLIGYLAVACITTYNGYRKSTVYAAAVVEAVDFQKRFNQHYYAVHGEWPVDEKQAQEFALATCLSYPGGLYFTDEEPGEIRQGAITALITGEPQLQRELVTMRPVVSADYSLGPVHYVVGNKKNEPGWLIFGTDRTNVEEKYLPEQILK